MVGTLIRQIMQYPVLIWNEDDTFSIHITCPACGERLQNENAIKGGEDGKAVYSHKCGKAVFATGVDSEMEALDTVWKTFESRLGLIKKILVIPLKNNGVGKFLYLAMLWEGEPIRLEKKPYAGRG